MSDILVGLRKLAVIIKCEYFHECICNCIRECIFSDNLSWAAHGEAKVKKVNCMLGEELPTPKSVFECMMLLLSQDYYIAF